MSGRRARQARAEQRASRQELTSGISIDGGYTLRLSRPGESDEIARLCAMAGVELEDEVRQALDGPVAGDIVARALRDGDQGLHAMAQYWSTGPEQAVLASTTAIVAEHPDHEGLAGMCMASLPGAVLARALSAGVEFRQVLMLAVQTRRLKALAVDPEHRRHGLGAALLRQASRVFRHQLHCDLYAHIDDPDLVPWYEHRGFTVLPLGAGLNMQWLIDRPLIIRPGPREQLAILPWPPTRRQFVVPLELLDAS